MMGAKYSLTHTMKEAHVLYFRGVQTHREQPGSLQMRCRNFKQNFGSAQVIRKAGMTTRIGKGESY